MSSAYGEVSPLGDPPMTRTAPRGPGPTCRVAHVVRGLLLSWLALVLAVLGALGTPRPAYAQNATPAVVVEIDSLDPAIPTPDGTITLRGRAVNRTGDIIEGAQVVLWRHLTPLTNTAGLRQVVGQAPANVSGQQMWSGAAYQPLTSEDQPAWPAGETRTFELTAPVRALGATENGVVLIGAQVVGRPGGQTLGTLGEARVLVPVAGSLPATANPVVSVVVLSSRPAMIEPGLFLDDHLAGELAPQGRLSHLLRAAQQPDTSWLIDPALLQELSSMGEGYRVRTAEGERPGTAAEQARSWLAEFEQLDRTRGYRVPFAIPDASMLNRSDLSPLMLRAEAAASRVPGVTELPLIAYATGGSLSPEALPLVESSDPVAVLASTPDARGALLSPQESVPIVNFSTAVTAAGPGPEPSTSLVQTRQRMIAESLLVATGDPGLASVRVITSGHAAAADQYAEAPWLTRTSLSDLLADTPAAWSETWIYGPTARAAELNRAETERLAAISGSFTAFLDMLADPEPFQGEADAALARLSSSWWRNDTAGFEAYAAPHLRAAEGLWAGQAVELTAQRSVIMSGQSGSFPMTVTNNLDQPLRVTLTFESFQPQRLSIPDMTNVVVPANAGVTVNVQPRAVGNGPVRISSQVLAPSGRPISKRAWLTVEATNFGRVGWIIIVASGIVLLAATTWRIRQVRRERRRAAPPVTAVPVHETPPIVRIDSPNRGDER